MANAHSPISDIIHYGVMGSIGLVAASVLAFLPCIVPVLLAAVLTAVVAGRMIDQRLADWLGKRGIWS